MNEEFQISNCIHPPHGLHKLTRNGQAATASQVFFLLERNKEKKRKEKGVACDVSQRWR
jgi:hypothetical protein